MKPCLSLFALVLLLTSCVEDERINETFTPDLSFSNAEMAVLDEQLKLGDISFNRTVEMPHHIAFNTAAGTTTMELPPEDLTKALLGRVLFYDTQLSATGETSCATCHKQELAFGDDLAFSKGINGGHTKRNSIALASVPTFASEVSGYGETASDGNSFTQGSVAFFWDERAATIKQQSEMTIQDRVEMGRDLEDLAEDLKRQEMYRILTRKAYGTDDLTPDRITLALEKFCATITSMDSPFDDLVDANMQLLPNNDAVLATFTEEEKMGHALFNDNCGQCHGFNMAQPNVSIASNGLDLSPTDLGVGEHLGSGFNGIFKVPFLRNVALTAPYMHDGRFETLEEVIDHYSEGIQQHDNLHPNLIDWNTGAPRNMHFTDEEKGALVAFLKLTNDRSVMQDASLSDPFRR